MATWPGPGLGPDHRPLVVPAYSPGDRSAPGTFPWGLQGKTRPPCPSAGHWGAPLARAAVGPRTEHAQCGLRPVCAHPPPGGLPSAPGRSFADPGPLCLNRAGCCVLSAGRPSGAGPRAGRAGPERGGEGGAWVRWAARGPFKARPGRAPRRGPFKAWPTWQPLEPRTRSEAGRWVLPVEAAAGAGADGPSAEGASERARERASERASRASRRRHGPERPDGHGRGLRRPGAACGPVRPGRPPHRPSCRAPGLGVSGAPPVPRGAGPRPPGRPEAWPGPSRCRARSPSPSRALPPGLAACPGRGTPKLGLGGPARPCAVCAPGRPGCVPRARASGARLCGPVLPS